MRRAVLTSVVALALLPAQGALAHKERPTPSPPREGSVPDPNRTHSMEIDVCKVTDPLCEFEHVQDAVTAASDGALIRIWPGTYHEEPSRARPDLPPDNPDGTYSFEFHTANPNAQNLIAVVGKKDITLRGMGATPRDVVIDAAFTKHVALRGDRSDGIILENFSVWHGLEHGVYILDTSGFLIDEVHSGYSRDYPFLTFADDHGLMRNCEAFGGGDGGIYPGSSAETPGRVSTEITGCKAYHNVLGYSGTQGDHVWVHDNDFFDNTVGFVTDSEADHPNYPQNNLVFENNRVYDNNFNPYLETSDVKATVFADFAFLPVGTGLFMVSGNDNLFQDNQFWGNDRYAIWLASGYGMIIGPTGPVTTGEPFMPPFMSSKNRVIGNSFVSPGEVDEPNGVDIAWDGFGEGNCFEANVGYGPDDAVTSDQVFLPPCTVPAYSQPMPTTVGVPNANLFEQASLVIVEGEPICHRLGRCEWGPGPAPENARNLPEGYRPPPDPAPCGPSTCP